MGGRQNNYSAIAMIHEKIQKGVLILDLPIENEGFLAQRQRRVPTLNIRSLDCYLWMGAADMRASLAIKSSGITAKSSGFCGAAS